MDTLVFAHANGFTPGAYAALLAPLRSGFVVQAPPLGPLVSGRMPSGDWAEIADGLAAAVEAAGSPVLGVGHSLGAVALLMLAARQPGCFSRLVLLDPVALPAWGCALLRLAPAAVRRRAPLAQAAARRAGRWPDAAAAWAETRARRWFADVPDAVLQQVFDDGLVADGEGVALRFRPAWEARLYECPRSVWPLLRGPLPPLTVLHGARSRLFTAADARRWRARRPQDHLQVFEHAGHLLPLEQPEAVARAMARAARG